MVVFWGWSWDIFAFNGEPGSQEGCGREDGNIEGVFFSSFDAVGSFTLKRRGFSRH